MDASGRLFHRTDDHGPVALHSPEQGVANLVGRFGVRQLGVLFEEDVQVERLTRTQLRVAVVQQELTEHTHPARPLHRSEQEIEEARARGTGLLASDESLRDQKDRLRVGSLFCDERFNQIDFEFTATARLAAEFRWPSKEE